MCGRYFLASSKSAIRQLFRLKQVPELPPRYNIAPSQPIVAIRQNPHLHHRELTVLNWGLIPFWTKDVSQTRGHINARVETVFNKRSFMGPIRHHRCLIPCNGFYEWQRRGKDTTPFLFTSPEHPLIALAGLYDYWGSPDGSAIESCCILTTHANKDMEAIHDRMPLIIHPEDFDRWLDPERQTQDSIQDLLKPAPDHFLQSRLVSSKLNHSQNDDASLLVPDASPSPVQSELF